MALLKATEEACVRKEWDLSDFWPTGWYLDHQVMSDGRAFLELCADYLCFCVCARVHVHTQVCQREYTYWNFKVLYSMYLSFSLLEKHLQYCDKFINWNVFSSLFISFVKETEIWGKQVKRLKPEEHILNYRISPEGFFFRDQTVQSQGFNYSNFFDRWIVFLYRKVL